MLTLAHDTLGWIIMKARELDVKDVDTSDGDAGDDDAYSVLESRGNDASESELRSWIADLNDTEQAELVALFWLGRGDGTEDEFDELIEQARAAKTGPTEIYLLGEPLLADMLEEGLEKLGIPVSDIESEV